MENSNHLHDKSLSPGPFTFTRDRIEIVLRNGCFVRGPSWRHDGVPAPFKCDAFESVIKAGVYQRSYTEEEHAVLVERFCVHLYELAQNAESHVSCLDDLLSTILRCNWVPKDSIPAIVDRALDLLTRLPARPLELPDLPAFLHPAYLIPSASGDEDSIAIQWQKLQVTAHVGNNVIRCALFSMMHSFEAPMRGYIDSIAELLEVASQLSTKAETTPKKQHWFIVRAFLWTSWQRCAMIFFYLILDGRLISGFTDHAGISHTLRGTVPAPGLSVQEMSKLYAGSRKSQYMCGWAFELLRNNTVCLGMDFRRFHQRYSEAFQNHPSRCIADNSNTSCKGDQPSSCQRFQGMVIKNQSAHDLGCPGDCGRLTWNEVSYRSISGARAVLIDEDAGLEMKIKYCEASKQTLAISHVWSHGQGGRPEEPHGFNHCLHRRYVLIAKSLGCKSYWMDTPCIPEDHELRAESISKINEVFRQSKVTLVCDRDLMEIDATDLSIDVRERLLVTVIVSDWNLRAWTSLEAFRGRNSIYLLCKDNAVVSLKETIEIVHRHGSIDISFLLLTVPHLLAPLINPYHSEYFNLETSGSLLSHRQASRPGDDMVIWSLFLEERVFDDAASFWRSREGKLVNTGYLLSSAPRLGVRGLSWAPSSPNPHLVAATPSEPTSWLLSHDGTGSERGRITSDGFRAPWLMYPINGPGMTSKAIATISWMKLGFEKLGGDNVRRICKKYLKGYRWGALLRPRAENAIDTVPAPNLADTSKILVVVCATNDRVSLKLNGMGDIVQFKKNAKDDGIFWEWKGIYEWDQTESLPRFREIKDVLLV